MNQIVTNAFGRKMGVDFFEDTNHELAEHGGVKYCKFCWAKEADIGADKKCIETMKRTGTR